MNLYYALWQSLSLLDFQTLQILPFGNVRVYCSFLPTWCVAGHPRHKKGRRTGVEKCHTGVLPEAFNVLTCCVTVRAGRPQSDFFSVLRARHTLQKHPGFPLLVSCFGHSTPILWHSIGRLAPLSTDGGHASRVTGTARGRVGSSSSSGHLGRHLLGLSRLPARVLSVRRLGPLEIRPGPALG